MASVMYLYFDMQEKDILEHTKCQVSFVYTKTIFRSLIREVDKLLFKS